MKAIRYEFASWKDFDEISLKGKKGREVKEYQAGFRFFSSPNRERRFDPAPENYVEEGHWYWKDDKVFLIHRLVWKRRVRFDYTVWVIDAVDLSYSDAKVLRFNQDLMLRYFSDEMGEEKLIFDLPENVIKGLEAQVDVLKGKYEASQIRSEHRRLQLRFYERIMPPLLFRCFELGRQARLELYEIEAIIAASATLEIAVETFLVLEKNVKENRILG